MFNTTPQERPTILRLPAVRSESGYSRSTLYLRMSQGLWTAPVALGARAVGWPASEVAALNAARIAGKNDDQIRALVAELHAARKCVGSNAPRAGSK
jgi:prophage regulatory protein